MTTYEDSKIMVAEERDSVPVLKQRDQISTVESVEQPETTQSFEANLDNMSQINISEYYGSRIIDQPTLDKHKSYIDNLNNLSYGTI